MSHWLIALPYFGKFAGLGSIIGLFLWARTVKSQARPVLSLFRRGMLALLLAGLLFGWWSALFPSRDSETNLKKEVLDGPFSTEMADALNIAVPAAASFGQADIRTVNNRKVLMLLPPCSIEWKLSMKHRAVEISYGFEPTAYEQGTTNGAEVLVELVDEQQTTQVFQRLLDPIKNSADRGLQHTRVELPPYHPGSRLLVRTTPGAFGDTAWDWVYLAGLHWRN
jgi:hypothetical protein